MSRLTWTERRASARFMTDDHWNQLLPAKLPVRAIVDFVTQLDVCPLGTSQLRHR